MPFLPETPRMSQLAVPHRRSVRGAFLVPTFVSAIAQVNLQDVVVSARKAKVPASSSHSRERP
eukprot:10347489-Lingulodinium_polyedra.AAC.1